jgi:hypothetical protein
VSTAAIQKLEERYCRAVALAVLGDATKVDLIRHTNANRFQGIRHDPAVDQNLWVDVSFNTVPPSTGRDGTAQGLTFTSTIKFDRFVAMGRIRSTSAQSVLSSPSAFTGITTPAGLGRYFVANPSDTICISAGSDAVLGAVLATGVPSASINQPTSAPASYNGDNGGANGVPCHAIVSTNLALLPSTANPDNFLANVTIEHQNAAGYTREVKELVVNGLSLQADKGDQKWDALVNAIVNGVQTAALYGVDSSNVTAMCNRSSPVPHDDIAQLLGITTTLSPPQAGDTVGLRNDWACDVIAQLGNYNEFWAAVEADIFATSGVIVGQATFYNGFNQLFQDPSGLPTGGLIVPLAPSAF